MTILQALRIIDSLKRGEVNMQMLPEEDLKEALIHIQALLPQGTTLAFAPDRNYWAPYYHNLLAYKLPGEDDIRGVLQIPLAQRNQLFHVYNLRPFPNHLSCKQ